ncbi:AAA family ATPase [Metamycoplasma buccale]|uniref:AAA family ATPase n=1 Tax=Metamycoplasma buccale TaxID=55602 RepID=UPI00398F4C9C
MSELIKVSGIFKKILWEKNASNYRITSFKIISQYNQKSIIKTNNFGNISIISENVNFDLDKYYDITIEQVTNSKYPNTYNLIDIKESEYWKLNYIVKFLQSKHFPGIGEVKGRNIVEKYGFDTLNVIATSEKIKANDLGISEESFNTARKYLKENPQVVEDQIFFLKLNLSPSFYEKVTKKFLYLADFLTKYGNNFYDYYFDEIGISVSDLDKLTKHFFPNGHEFTESMHLYQTLEEYFFNMGHTKTSINDFYNYYFKNYEKINSAKFKEVLKILIQSNRVLLFDNKSFITTFKLREMEEYVITRLKKINETPNFLKFKEVNKTKFHSLQNKAINLALNENLVLITGSPGTGKTLITNEIIWQLLNQLDEEEIAIVTPTGRATININKSSQKKAVTIHSFLQWNLEENRFEINENWPIHISCLIIDEFSMVSLDLMYALLKGISKKTLNKIILVGDKNQLPAIGHGYLIHDFIECNIFKVIELTKIYRQSDNYEIIEDAVSINKSELPAFNGKNSQFRITKKETLSKELINEIENLLKKGFTKKDIAILSPIYNYQTGIDKLNEDLTTFWHKKYPKEVAKIGKKNYMLDDKVLNTVNDPAKKVFNGEIGYISHFSYDKNDSLNHVTVDFEDDEKSVTYTKSDFLQKTIPAYCTSVHKYQGSECPIVLTVLFSEAKKLLSKKLIYTAITRAKKMSIIFGEEEALIKGINNDEDSKRKTCIKELWETIEKR